MVDEVARTALVIDASGAQKGAADFDAAAKRVIAGNDQMVAATDRVVTSFSRQQATLDSVARRVDPFGAAVRKASQDVDNLNKIATSGSPKAAEAIALIPAAQAKLVATQKAATEAANDNKKALDANTEAHVRLSGQAQAAMHSVRSMAEQMVMGVGPTQILTQQLGHLSYAASGPGGLTGAFAGLGTMLRGFITPATATAGAVALVAGSVGLLVARAEQGEGALRAYSVLLRGMGTGGLASPAQLLGAERQLRDLGMSTTDARSTILDIGRAGLNPAAAGSIGTTGRNLGAVLGGDGTQTLINALKGGIGPTIELAMRIQALSAAEAINIEEMARHGDTAAALDKAFQSISDHVKGLADEGLGPAARAMRDLKTTWNDMLDSLSKNNVIVQFVKDLTELLRDIDAIAKGQLGSLSNFYANRLPGGGMEVPIQGSRSSAGGGALSRDQILDLIMQYESHGRNVFQGLVPASQSTAQGYFQITNQTWRGIAGAAGIDLGQYPNAMSAPYDVQRRAAGALYDQRGVSPWAPYNPALAAALNGAGGTASITNTDALVQQLELLSSRLLEVGQRELSQATALLSATGPDAYARQLLANQAAVEAFQHFGGNNQNGRMQAFGSARLEQLLAIRDAQRQGQLNQLGFSANFESQQIGRSADEQAIFSRLRAAGGLDDNGGIRNAQAEMLANQLRFNQALLETKSIASDFATGFINDILSGTSAIHALTNAVQRLASRLADKAIDQLLSPLFSTTGPASGLLSLLGLSGAGTYTGTSMLPGLAGSFGVAAPVGHTGGIVGSLTAIRMVGPEIFANAPRFHSGMPDLMPGERGVIVKTDEGIFTPEQMRALGKGSSVTNHNVSIGDITIGPGNNIGPIQAEQIFRRIVKETLDPRKQRSSQTELNYNEG